MFLQEPKAPHHLIEGPVAFAVATIAVMDLLRAIKADPHHEIVLLEKLAPFISKQRPVGLQRVADRLSLREWLLELDDPFKEIDPQKGRFPPLPDELNDRCGLGCDVIGYERGEDLIGHAVLLAGAEEGLLLKIKAVLAVEVAHRADRLRDDMDALAYTLHIPLFRFAVHQ